MTALADDLYAFLDRPRGARPHFHACTECYEDEACGLDCTTDEDEDNPAVQRGGFGVCSLCRRAAAVEPDTAPRLHIPRDLLTREGVRR